ncbi:cellulose binding domain-containing protein [Streptomyces fractus]|uniref:cellulose binding domain-containing protein n=1 Tax=Streptomyces fractus TaxID=641806 RepID=UPI003CF2B83C
MRHPPHSALLMVCAVSAATLIPLAGTASASAAAPACTVEYSVTGQWGDGFQGAVKVTNNGAAKYSWSLSFGFADGQKVTQGWSAKWSQSGTTVTAGNETWNGALPTGASVSAGFVGSWSGANTVPTAFRLNGTTCDTDTTGPIDPTDPTDPTGPGDGAAPALKVSGNKLVDASGATRRILGVNRSGAEFMCVQGHGIFDGPVDDAAIKAIADWKSNAVRIPLNEECWLGLDNIKPEYGGANYRSAIKQLVDRVTANGMTPVLEMHWSYGQYTGNSAGCSDVHASCQKPMPDAKYAPSFWSSVADTFKARPEVAGMQDLVDAVRAAGAPNLILAGGLAYSNDLRQWLAHKPSDPAGNLAAAWHVYNFNTCAGEACWAEQLAPVAAQVPLVAGEIGENTCSHAFIDRVMKWFDERKLSYLGWTWNTWDCSSGPSLISDYDGTPTNFGVGLRDHLKTLGN